MSNPTPRMLQCLSAYTDAGQQAALECAATLDPLPDVAYCPGCECETYADDGVCLVCWSECDDTPPATRDTVADVLHRYGYITDTTGRGLRIIGKDPRNA